MAKNACSNPDGVEELVFGGGLKLDIEEHGSEAKDNRCTQVKPKTHHTSEDWKQNGHSEPGTVPKADSLAERCLKGHQKAGSWSS